jgi:lipopolysaccharide export system protein LptA
MFFSKRSFPADHSHRHTIHRHAIMVMLFVLCSLSGLNAFAQKNVVPAKKDTSKSEQLYLKNVDVMTNTKTDSGDLTKFLGNAVFTQGTDTLYCDSLYQHVKTKIYEAFSNVRIAQQGGTQGTCNYLRFTAGQKEVFMTGNVALTDGKNRLVCEELTYNLGTKTGVYNKGGTLYSDSTTVQSNTGVYNVTSKDARFKGNVHINGINPQYKITSDDVGYNTETKFESFFAHSIIVSDSGKSIVETKSGTYDSQKGVANLTAHSSIWDDGQYIEGDKLNYDKMTGIGLGIGHVISIDTAHHATLFCDRLEYYQKKRVLWATGRPVLRQADGRDTIYMRADTFYSAPMVKVMPVPKKLKAKTDSTVKAVDSSMVKNVADTAIAADTLAHLKVKKTIKPPDTVTVWVHGRPGKKLDTIRMTTKPGYKIPAMEDTMKIAGSKKSRHKKGTLLNNAVAVDTSTADTTAPLYFIGYHHVKIFSDSLQGTSDSVCYTRSDSTIRMMYAPICWAHNSQITGDTILIHLDTNEVRSIFVPNNAFVVSRSGPVKAQLFDQVQGRTLTAYFKHNAITNAIVFPNAEAIYFPTDEKGAYLGMNESKSERMRIFFEEQKIVEIKLEQEADLTVTPMEKADFPNARLSRFKWLIDSRPKTKEELFK